MTTHISILMDKSGSMWDKNLYVEAAGSTNEFIKEAKKIPGRKSITINQFDNIVENTCSQVAPSKVPELVAGENYTPRGGTALYDALGKTITDLGKKKNVLVCVVTDGEENCSREYTYETIKQMISEKTDAGWKFDFLSSDLKAMQMSMDLGMNRGRSLGDFHFADSAVGYASTTSLRSASLADYMVDKS